MDWMGRQKYWQYWQCSEVCSKFESRGCVASRRLRFFASNFVFFIKAWAAASCCCDVCVFLKGGALLAWGARVGTAPGAIGRGRIMFQC